MSPEQLARDQRLQRAKEDLASLMKVVPAGVMSGGTTRLDAWRKAMANAKKAMASASKDPIKYEEAAVLLRACEGGNPSELAKAAYEKRSGSR